MRTLAHTILAAIFLTAALQPVPRAAYSAVYLSRDGNAWIIDQDLSRDDCRALQIRFSQVGERLECEAQ